MGKSMVPVQPIQTVRPFMLLPDELFTQSPSVDGHEGAGGVYFIAGSGDWKWRELGEERDCVSS